MKKIIIGLIGIFLVFFSSIIVNASVNSDWADSNNMAKYKQVDTEFRAVWVATVSNIDISKQKNKSDEAINEWKQNYLSILDNAEKYNLNAIIFQIDHAMMLFTHLSIILGVSFYLHTERSWMGSTRMDD